VDSEWLHMQYVQHVLHGCPVKAAIVLFVARSSDIDIALMECTMCGFTASVEQMRDGLEWVSDKGTAARDLVNTHAKVAHRGRARVVNGWRP
jgi:hypothetical protein